MGENYQLVIIGSGSRGGEAARLAASIYRTRGRLVTLIEKENRILPAWEPEAGKRVGEMLEMRGV